jgi:hypothetical protein
MTDEMDLTLPPESVPFTYTPWTPASSLSFEEGLALFPPLVDMPEPHPPGDDGYVMDVMDRLWASSMPAQ